MRIALEAGPTGRPMTAVNKLAAETTTAPPEARPLLRLLQARWLFTFYQDRRWDFVSRSATTTEPGGVIETWDLSRILAEIDKRFQESLADKSTLQKIPVAAFNELLKPGDLGDDLRPTLYDFIAHKALEYYTLEEVAASKPQDDFEIDAGSAALDSTAAFLAWHPQARDPIAPKFRALQLYQDLLTLHQADPNPAAFLHCDLERIRWAGKAAVDPDKDARLDAALRAFIDANAKHPLSADARQDVAKALIEKKRTLEAHAIAAAGAAAFPKHPFGKLCKILVNNLERKTIMLETATAWTPAGEDITINHANIPHVWFRACRREWTPDNNTLKHDPVPESDTAERAALLRQKPVLTWDAALPDDKDYRQRHTTLPAPEQLEPGYYIIIASVREYFSHKDNCIALLPVHVTTHAMLVRRQAGNLDGFVTDAVTGAPRAGVDVSIRSTRKTLPKMVTASTITDADGWFSLPVTGKEADVLIVAGSKDDFACARPYLTYFSSNEDVTGNRRQVVFFTDRSIYRPGQTVHFKGIYCESDRESGNLRTLAGQQATVVLMQNLTNKEIQSLEVRSNELGSFSGTFTAPSGGLLGYFRIAVKDLGTTTIRVEEYKRPKFFTELKPPQEPAALGAKVTLKGKAEGYASAAVDGAKVTWSVSRSANWPQWIHWCGEFSHLKSDDKEIATGTATTATDGSFLITFIATPDPTVDPKTDPVFCYEVYADVTDSAGETHSTDYEVAVAYTTLKASLATGEWQKEDAPVVFKVLTQSHDDVGRPAEGVLTIHKLQEPEHCPRGNLSGGYLLGKNGTPDLTDVVHWKPGEVVKELAVRTGKANTDKAGEAEVSATLPAGIYRAVFITKDTNGRSVQAIDDFQVVKPSGDRFPTRIPFFAAAPKWFIEPGQPFTVLWGSGYQTTRACVEFYRDSTLLKREWSAPDRTQQAFTFTPDASLRGDITVVVTQTSLNRFSKFARSMNIPWQELKLSWEHSTSKLVPGQQETWTAIVTDQQGAAAPAEMVATLYDASLDAYECHSYFGFGSFCSSPAPYSETFSTQVAAFDTAWYSAGKRPEGFWFDNPFRAFIDDLEIMESPQLPQQNNCRGASGGVRSRLPQQSNNNSGGTGHPDPATVTARKNLQETAFFYPHLTSNEKGEVRITFTMPEALTKWKFLGFAHDKDLRCGTLEGETVTAKDLMVQPNPPRFLREGDVLDFTVKISNQSDKDQSGIARLTLCDAATQKDVTATLGIAVPDQAWTIPAKESRTLAWRLTVPDGSGFLTYKALATSGTLSDGEEGWLPVIPRRVLLTESLALPVRDAGTKDFTFQKLLDSGKSSTLENRSVQVQVVSQPAWYAVLALPYLMEFPHECAEQTFNCYYANALARHLATSNPKIRRIFDLWKNTPALDSPLTKNTDLKGILLEETPWLNEANEQSHHKLGLLFDDNQLGEQLELTLKKLGEMQDPSGLWPWFPGGRSNEYISLYITTGFARLRALGVNTDITPALKALPQLDSVLAERLDAIKKAAGKDRAKLNSDHLDAWVAYHLYTRTFFLKDCEVKNADKEAFEYYTAQAKKYWPSLASRMSRAHVALALARLGDMATARLITRSLREHAVSNEETGMSWQDSEGEGRWCWWQAPIETQAMMIEAFREIDHDAKTVDTCQVWLIQQLQVRNWHTTKATADAIHALLTGATDLLGSDAQLQVSLGGTAVKPEAIEAGTGFCEIRFAGPAIKPEMGNIQVAKTDPGVAWASVHWQYLEDLAKVTGHNATPLKLEKALFVRKNSPQGPKLEPVIGPVKVGDELVTRLVLRNDRAMEFVHLKDQRGSGTEPANVLSGYRWQDGFGYYEVSRDSASHFFIDTLPAGTHVFETSVRVQHAGTYQTGVAEIRCMYAPEFSAHSASIRLEVTR